MSVFIDTSAFLAILDADDRNHDPAIRSWTEKMEHGEIVFTSNYVVVETISLLHRRAGIPTVNRFRMDILPAVSIEWVDQAVHAAGISTVLASGKRGPSFVDCVSFETMRRLDIRSVFAYDKHFADAGFELV